MESLSLEHGALAGLVVFAAGSTSAGTLAYRWIVSGFASLSFTTGSELSGDRPGLPKNTLQTIGYVLVGGVRGPDPNLATSADGTFVSGVGYDQLGGGCNRGSPRSPPDSPAKT